MPILGMEISLLLSYFYVWQEVSKYFRLQWQETLLSCKMKPNKSYRSYFLWCQNEIFSARCHAKLTCLFIENIMPGIIHRQRVFHEITLTFLMAFHFLTKSNQNSLITPLENAQYWHLKLSSRMSYQRPFRKTWLHMSRQWATIVKNRFRRRIVSPDRRLSNCFFNLL